MISALDYERATVASAVKEQNVNVIDVMEKIDSIHFESSFCAKLWKNIKTLHKQNEPIDEMTVCMGNSEDYHALLSMIQNTTTNPLMIKAYAKKVRQAYNLRNAMVQMQLAIYEIKNCDCPTKIGEVALAVEQAFSQITVETDNKLPRSGAEILPDYIEMIQRRHDGDESEKTIKFGIDKLDEMLGGLNPVDLMVVGGCSGMGKTEFANKIGNGVLSRGYGVLNFTMEMDEMQIVERSVSDFAGLSVSTLRNPRGMTDTDWGMASNAMGEINNDLYWVHDETSISIEKICANARYVKNKQPKLSLIIVDYAQIMEIPKADRHDLALGIISSKLKSLAKELRCPVVLLSQLNEKQIKSRTDKRPLNGDLKDSSSLINDADRIIFIYRDEVYYEDSAYKGVAEIIINKNRFGMTGTVMMGWVNGHFVDVSDNDLAHMAHAEEVKQSDKNKRGKRGDF